MRKKKECQAILVTNHNLKTTMKTMKHKELIDFIFQVSLNFESLDLNLLIFLGYCGYVPSIKAENAFGESYGKTTGASVGG